MKEIEEKKLYKNNKSGWQIFRKIFTTIFFAGVAVIVAFFIQFSYRYSVYVVEGPSMQPTLNEFSIDGHDGKYDSVYVNLRSKYNLFDIIVFEHDNKYLIKRLIAQAGDYVNIVGVGAQNGTIPGTYYPKYEKYELVVKRAGESEFVALDESSYVSAENSRMEEKFKQFYEYKHKLYPAYTTKQICETAIKIEEGCIFALGDNRENSSDCAYFGPVSKSTVLGRVDFVLKNNQTSLQKLWYKFKIRFIIK